MRSVDDARHVSTRVVAGRSRHDTGQVMKIEK
jgi:hypothetical protein